MALLLAGTGFFSGCIIISFAFVMESVPKSLAGTVSGLTNMGIMIGPMILQPVVGKVLDANWAGEMVNGVRLYSLSAYRYGFTLMMGWVLLSTIILFFTKETYCQGIEQ